MELNRTVCFTGHRPKYLGGYDMKNPTMMNLKERLLSTIEELIKEGYDTFISGGALGTDQAAFWCVEILKREHPHIRNVVASPYLDQGKERHRDPETGKMVGWTAEQAMWYKKMIQRADRVIYVDQEEYYARDSRTSVGKHSNWKLNIRNEYMVDHSSHVVAVWNGVKAKSGTWNCIHYAQQSGTKTFTFIDPKEL